mmetsp:Transcript_124581/g.334436  ORF Transcript_124581/g.334436 Transcript_124581/m.334436 type:complete len:308 (-) Transcript_124581:1157-2080(-)
MWIGLGPSAPRGSGPGFVALELGAEVAEQPDYLGVGRQLGLLRRPVEAQVPDADLEQALDERLQPEYGGCFALLLLALRGPQGPVGHERVLALDCLLGLLAKRLAHQDESALELLEPDGAVEVRVDQHEPFLEDVPLWQGDSEGLGGLKELVHPQLATTILVKLFEECSGVPTERVHRTRHRHEEVLRSQLCGGHVGFFLHVKVRTLTLLHLAFAHDDQDRIELNVLHDAVAVAVDQPQRIRYLLPRRGDFEKHPADTLHHLIHVDAPVEPRIQPAEYVLGAHPVGRHPLLNARKDGHAFKLLVGHV